MQVQEGGRQLQDGARQLQEELRQLQEGARLLQEGRRQVPPCSTHAGFCSPSPSSSDLTRLVFLEHIDFLHGRLGMSSSQAAAPLLAVPLVPASRVSASLPLATVAGVALAETSASISKL